MDELALFDMEEPDPPALIYCGWATPFHEMRCRDCHQKGSMRGSGSFHATPERPGYRYMICANCCNLPGHRGALAHKAGITGRDTKKIHDE